jgi:hypothetical protein
LPTLENGDLRDCQVNAINGLENSFARQHARALAQMATGSGKTWMAVTNVTASSNSAAPSAARPQNNWGMEIPRTANSNPSPLFSVSFVSFCSPHRRQRRERKRRELGLRVLKVFLSRGRFLVLVTTRLISVLIRSLGRNLPADPIVYNTKNRPQDVMSGL